MTFSTSHARPDPSDSVVSSCGHLTYCIHQLEATLQFVSDFPQNHDNHLRKAVSGEIEITSATATPTARRRQPGETMAVAVAHTPPPKPLRQTFLLQMSAFYIPRGWKKQRMDERCPKVTQSTVPQGRGRRRTHRLKVSPLQQLQHDCLPARACSPLPPPSFLSADNSQAQRNAR